MCINETPKKIDSEKVSCCAGPGGGGDWRGQWFNGGEGVLPLPMVLRYPGRFPGVGSMGQKGPENTSVAARARQAACGTYCGP